MSEPKTQVALLPQPDELNPMQMLQIAVQRGTNADELKLMLELQREWKADKARDAFVAAMNGFRAEALKIVKSKAVEFGNTKYKHATLAQIVDVAAPALSKHGLSHRWETKQDGAITVSCIITHELGHSERTTLTAAPDTSGGKNSIQAIGSTVSYLQRYTFTAITGLAASDADDDARNAGGGAKINEQQAADLDALMSELGVDKKAFLEYTAADKMIGASTIAEIPVSAYQLCVDKVRAKGRQIAREKAKAAK